MKFVIALLCVHDLSEMVAAPKVGNLSASSLSFTVTVADDGEPARYPAPEPTCAVTLPLFSSVESSSVATVSVAVLWFALIVTLVGAVPLMNDPVWVTLTATARFEGGAVLAVSVNFALCPSVTDGWFREIETDRGSLSRTVTVANDGEPMAYPVPERTRAVMLPLFSSVLSLEVRTVNDALVWPREIRTEVGFVPLMNDPFSVTRTVTARFEDGALLARSVNPAVCPSSIRD